jgi:hypothetical protein
MRELVGPFTTNGQRKMPLNIKDDRLPNVAAIADFWGVDEKRARYLIRHGHIPVGREGNLIVGSKEQLRRRYRELFDAAIPEPQQTS